MTGIECKTLEYTVVYLGELNEKSSSENCCQAIPEVESSVHSLAFPPIDGNTYNKYDDVSDSFIQLRRMACHIVHLLKDNSPITTCCIAYNLRVPEIAQSYATSCYGCCYCYR